ncbi:hypothetical protein SCOCK_150038 [Actinacidiphila cocklensis]|uniref:Uncharacterized protein n=1 Tax=Actinacidiphila cocklensis TaxID=887465 RepID=A0A9W4GQY9_9ACTN|nr:hypothetical protein SCOCK_150038 [Actinacidiphila cocklensis]
MRLSSYVSVHVPDRVSERFVTWHGPEEWSHGLGGCPVLPPAVSRRARRRDRGSRQVPCHKPRPDLVLAIDHPKRREHSCLSPNDVFPPRCW